MGRCGCGTGCRSRRQRNSGRGSDSTRSPPPWPRGPPTDADRRRGGTVHGVSAATERTGAACMGEAPVTANLAIGLADSLCLAVCTSGGGWRWARWSGAASRRCRRVRTTCSRDPLGRHDAAGRNSATIIDGTRRRVFDGGLRRERAGAAGDIAASTGAHVRDRPPARGGPTTVAIRRVAAQRRRRGSSDFSPRHESPGWLDARIDLASQRSTVHRWCSAAACSRESRCASCRAAGAIR